MSLHTGPVEIVQKAQITLVRMFLLTNGKTTIQKADDIHTQNVLFQKLVIGIFPAFHGQGPPEQTVDDTDIFTKDFGEDYIACSSGNNSHRADVLVQTYLCVFPGIFSTSLVQFHIKIIGEKC